MLEKLIKKTIQKLEILPQKMKKECKYSQNRVLLYVNVTSEQPPPVNNGHKYGVLRVVVTQRFDCIIDSQFCHLHEIGPKSDSVLYFP